jgi:glycosyltransferase involved in cell wall biosynthesis/2-polyprenyl-3-methyl-5-hydroxy-6-metoxy-1,4-benzoquinol methylase
MSVVPAPPTSRYARTLEAEAADSLGAVAQRIAPGSAVLDLGAANGALGAHLVETKRCTVDGVELNPGDAAVARRSYRRVLELDLEQAILADHFPSAAYDAIVCADVLEHLRDPGRILDQLPALLAPGGRVLVSIPNVAYAGVLADLVAGRFDYRPTGLLDSTHLRFFTRSTLLRMLGEHGFRALDVHALTLDLQRSEFRDRFLEALPPAVMRGILAQPDALTYQFVVEAVPGPPAASVVPEPAWPELPRFGAQLYWADDVGRHREEDSAYAGGVVGEEHQTLAFPIPPLVPFPRALRLDPADRPGFLRLHRVRLVDGAGDEIWTWDPRTEPVDAAACRELVRCAGPLDDCWLATGYDPSIDLPVPPAALERLAGGGTLTMETSWPASADFVLALRVLDERERRWDAERRALSVELEHAARERKELEHEVARQRAALGQAHNETATAQGRIAELATAHGAALDALREETTRVAQQLASTRDQAHAAAQHLAVMSARVARIESEPSLRNVLRWTWRGLRRRRHVLQVLPGRQVLPAAGPAGTFEAVGTDPSFELVPSGGRYPTSWVLVDFEIARDADAATRPNFYVDSGLGYTEASRITLPRPDGEHLRAIVPLPAVVLALRFDPVEQPSVFRLGRLTMQELSRVEVALRAFWPFVQRMLRDPRALPATARDLVAAWRRSGWQGLKDAITDRSAREQSYGDWVAQYDHLGESDRAAIERRVAALPRTPLVSVLMPVFDTPEPLLRRAIDSVLGQLYPHWELCIADDASKRPHVRRVLAEYAARDRRIKVVVREENGHIAVASNSALEVATGDFVALLDHDDELAPHALYLIAEELNAHPDADLLYSDEDKLDLSGERRDPYFKPDWSPDLLLSHNYFCHLGVYRTALVRRLGGFRKGFEGSQDYDLVLRCARETAPARIRHIPHVLYHWRMIQGSTAAETRAKSYAETASLRALREHLAAGSHGADVEPGRLPTTFHVRWPVPDPAPRVTLVIPTRDGMAVLQRCIESILARTDYPNYEILVVDNQSRDPATLEYFASLRKTERVRILPFDAPFNYSAINNAAVRAAGGSVVALLNNDVEIITPTWLSEMVGLALRPDVGAVGAKLLYPDNRIQHGGVATGIMGVAGHLHRFLPRDAPGYAAQAQVVTNVSVVTAACLVVRRALYDEVGGLDEKNLAIAFNDVDFCLRLDAAGYRNVWTPFAELYHHESFSRGLEDTPEKQARFAREIQFMERRWGRRLVSDPYYSPNLSLFSERHELAWPPRAVKPWIPPTEREHDVTDSRHDGDTAAVASTVA